MLPSHQLREVTLRDYLALLRRRIWVILACFIIVTTWATLKTLKKVPLYRAQAKILIEAAPPRIAPVQEVYTTSSWVDKQYLRTQIDIITSRTLAKKVVENLITAGDATFAGMREPELFFLGGVNVTQQIGSQIMNIGYISTNPVRAAKFANALTETYIQQDIEKRVMTTKYATGWLETQLAEMKKKLEASESALNDYIQKNEIVTVTDIERKTQASLEALKQEKINIENELAELSKRYKAKHPKMVALNTRLEAVKVSIEEETKKVLFLSEKMIQYNALKREVESNKSLYESLLKRIKETEVSEELKTTNISVVDLADIPKAPFTPNRRRDMQIGAIFGLFLGLGLALLLEYLDSSIKNADDIEMYVKLPFLGYVPSAKREARIDKEIDLISQMIPQSRIAEAYRSIRTSIIFSSTEDKPLKTILITSASPQEGKTTVSINLGIVFVHANEKTVIVEADMRKPRISPSFNLENKEGLSNVLTGTANLDKAIKQTNIPNLYLLSSGPKPPNPAELLTSAKMREVLDTLKTKFNRVIIDSPPVLTVTDTAILANIVDGVIDVVRAGFLNVELILRGKQRLYEAKSRIVGVVLNNVNVKREDSYYYYHYYYSEGKEKTA